MHALAQQRQGKGSVPTIRAVSGVLFRATTLPQALDRVHRLRVNNASMLLRTTAEYFGPAECKLPPPNVCHEKGGGCADTRSLCTLVRQERDEALAEAGPCDHCGQEPAGVPRSPGPVGPLPGSLPHASEGL